MSEKLESLRGSFNRSLRVEGKADRTLVLYGQSITYFSQWLDERGLTADLSNLTRDNVLGWLDALCPSAFIRFAVAVGSEVLPASILSLGTTYCRVRPIRLPAF